MSLERVLVLGSKGTLGGQLLKVFPEATGWDREDVDVTDSGALRRRVDGLGFVPAAVINCVAFNDVDGAEDRPQAAHALNETLPGRLAELTRELGIPLLHYSTNYVFDGVVGEYQETDRPAPLSVYGRSKWGGEQRVAEAAELYYIVRTAVIFGPKGESDLSKKSFVDLMRDLAATRDTIQAVSDEKNSITYAPDLAAATRALLERRPAAGIYHLANRGAASWYDLACEIFRIAGKRINVLPVPSTHFPRKARRPATAVLRNTRLPELRSWQEALAEFLRAGDPTGHPRA